MDRQVDGWMVAEQIHRQMGGQMETGQVNEWVGEEEVDAYVEHLI